MKFLLFIGHHKTGSSALQRYLADNYLKLVRRGILYPAVESQGFAMNLASALADTDLFSLDTNRKGRLNVREPHNALAFRMLSEVNGASSPAWHGNLPPSEEMFRTIQAQIDALMPHTVVLASEVMSRFADKGSRRLLAMMNDMLAGQEVTIVLTLRRIDLHISSWHLQRLKFLARLESLRDGAQSAYYETVHFRYDRIVSRWREAFPDAKLIVRNYNDVVAAGGSVQDFFSQGAVSYDPGPETRQVNSSVPYALAETARVALQRRPKLGRALVDYILSALPRLDIPPNESVEMFGQRLRDELCDAFEPVHADLCAQLGLATFFPDQEKARDCRPINELDAAQEALMALKADARANLPAGPVKEMIRAMNLAPG